MSACIQLESVTMRESDAQCEERYFLDMNSTVRGFNNDIQRVSN